MKLFRSTQIHNVSGCVESRDEEDMYIPMFERFACQRLQTSPTRSSHPSCFVVYSSRGYVRFREVTLCTSQREKQREHRTQS